MHCSRCNRELGETSICEKCFDRQISAAISAEKRLLEQRRSRIEELETDVERLKVDKKELAEQSNLFRRQRNTALDEICRVQERLNSIKENL